MADSLFVCGTDAEAGSSIVALGLFGVLRRLVKDLAFYKPVGGGKEDSDVAVMRTAYGLLQDPADVCPLTIEQARELVSRQAHDALLQRIRGPYQRLRESSRFILLEGINNQRSFSAFDMDINQAIAAHLRTPVLLVTRAGADGRNMDLEQLAAGVLTANRAFEDRNVEVLGVVVNRVSETPFSEARARIAEAFRAHGIPLFGVVPALASLGYPKLDQVAADLNAEVLSGGDALHTVATKTIIAAMEPGHFLRYLDTDKTLVVMPGDREGVLATLACAQKSPRRRSVSGIVLTGGLRPDPEIVQVIEELGLPSFPVLSVAADTFTTATRIQNINVRIRPEDRDKIDTASLAISQNVEHERLWELLEMPRPPRKRMSPQDFLDEIIEQARASKKRVVLPEGEEPRTIQAVKKILQEKVCPVVLLGDADTIHWSAEEAGFKLRGDVEVIEPQDPARDFNSYIHEVVEARKGKRGGMTPDVARQWLEESYINFGTAMVRAGDVDGLVAGAIHATADTIRPALQIIRVKPEMGICSSVFFMALRDRVLVYGDCAIVPNPDAQELAAIAYASARTARAFGIEPRVAMLSYSTGKSGAGESVDKVTEATKLVKERNPDLIIDGPLQYDAAIDPEVGRLKQPDSPVAGRATVFVFPDLDAGNIAYKAVQRSAGAVAVGPVLQGLNRPVNDLSRGCTVDDIYYTIAVTAIQAANA